MNENPYQSPRVRCQKKGSASNAKRVAWPFSSDLLILILSAGSYCSARIAFPTTPVDWSNEIDLIVGLAIVLVSTAALLARLIGGLTIKR